MIERISTGRAQKTQFYYIRGTPTESAEDWRRFRDWVDYILSVFDPLRIAVEFMLTPLTRTPHTPLQWVESKYNFDSEEETLNLLSYARRRKHEKPESMLYVTASRRAPAWLLDTAFQCGSRNLSKFLYAIHSGKIGTLDADSFDGRGYDRVKTVLRASGTDPDELTAAWDPGDVLPWSYITPFGDRGARARVAAYNKIMKLIAAHKSGGTYNPITRAIQLHKPGSA